MLDDLSKVIHDHLGMMLTFPNEEGGAAAPHDIFAGVGHHDCCGLRNRQIKYFVVLDWDNISEQTWNDYMPDNITDTYAKEYGVYATTSYETFERIVYDIKEQFEQFLDDGEYYDETLEDIEHRRRNVITVENPDSLYSLGGFGHPWPDEGPEYNGAPMLEQLGLYRNMYTPDNTLLQSHGERVSVWISAYAGVRFLAGYLSAIPTYSVLTSANPMASYLHWMDMLAERNPAAQPVGLDLRNIPHNPAVCPMCLESQPSIIDDTVAEWTETVLAEILPLFEEEVAL